MTTPVEHRVTFTQAGQAELVTAPRPAEPLGPQDVAGRTLVSAVSPGTELALYQGQHRRTTFPVTPGYSAVFAVEAVGNGVADVRPGQHLFSTGGHRSHQRAARADVLPVPEGLASADAALARLMAISMTTLVTAAARPPAKVLVTGLGIVGRLAVQVFAAGG
jgi:NADPH:quinone reductase-like Zn-dependent oxidoreductase